VVITLSNVIAIILQTLSLKLGVITGRDLAQACRDNFGKPVAFGLWILAEVAISATVWQKWSVQRLPFNYFLVCRSLNHNPD